MRRARLIYTVGPSGAGKDSLLAWLRARGDSRLRLHFAQRCITRPSLSHGEQHESVDVEEFRRLLGINAFALSWQANGLYYGIRRLELEPLVQGDWVLVNGSRAYLEDAMKLFPGLTVLHIVASTDTLRQRLQKRARETPAAIESRIARAASFRLPTNVPAISIQNDSTIDEAGERLHAALLELMQALRPIESF